jgi:succinate dehydrogenase / fumarate reductase cytochrome b subunit
MDTEQPAGPAPPRRPSASPRRPKYYDLSLAHLPPPGLVSILHRVSGLVLFFPILPALLFVLDETLRSELGFADWREFITRPPVKLVLIGVAWMYAHHFFAGIRFLLLDVHWGIGKQRARTSAWIVLVLGALVALATAGWMW